jgi:hypothetical protein
MAAMRAFSELAGLDLHWSFDTSPVIPSHGDRHYVLFAGQGPVAEAQASWLRFVSFDAYVESQEGTYAAHLDLRTPGRPGVAWRVGSSTSLAGSTVSRQATIKGVAVSSESTITCADGSSLTFRPQSALGATTQPYNLLDASNSVLLEISPATAESPTTGHLCISAAAASRPDLPALVALAFALANEQFLGLHLALDQGGLRFTGMFKALMGLLIFGIFAGWFVHPLVSVACLVVFVFTMLCLTRSGPSNPASPTDLTSRLGMVFWGAVLIAVSLLLFHSALVNPPAALDVDLFLWLGGILFFGLGAFSLAAAFRRSGL